MKRILHATFAGLLAVSIVAPSFAADLPRPGYRPAYKAQPMYVAPFSWTGFYVGINGGYGWGTSNWLGPPATLGFTNPKGGLAGGTIGYNVQTGLWVWGLEGDFDGSWMKASTAVGNGVCAGIGCETESRWLATARGRIGYAWDRFLPYVTGGAAFGQIKMTPGIPPTATDTKVGWMAGGGIEWAFLGNWSAKVEYLYVDLGKADCDATVCVLPTEVSFKANVVKAGINYRFW